MVYDTEFKSASDIIKNNHDPAFKRVIETGFKLLYKIENPDDEEREICIKATKSDVDIGSANFIEEETYIIGQNIDVKTEFKRSGVGTAMVVLAVKVFRKPLVDFWDDFPKASEDGKLFMKHLRRKRPDLFKASAPSSKKANQDVGGNNKIWGFANRPLSVALVSSLLFALIVAKCGANFQHQNWLQQNALLSKRVAEEKLFDKRAEIIRELFYLNKKQSQNLWNLHHSKISKDVQKTDKYKEINQEIISNYSALLEEMKIYFNIKEEPKLIQNTKNIIDIWHIVNSAIAAEKATDQFITDQSNKTDAYRKEIQEILYKIMKKTGSVETSSNVLIYSTPSDASPPMSRVVWGNQKE